MRSWWLCCVPVVLLAGAAPASCELLLNEILPAPGSDWNGNGMYSSSDDEWVEIFNPGPASADLGEYFVADAGGISSPRGGASGSLAAGEHLFLTGELAADWASAHGFPASGLSLNNSGDTVHLFRTAGGTTTLVDSLTYGSTAADVSIGRLPDGAAAWTAFDALQSGSGVQPTPGGANGGIASPQILSVTMEPASPADVDTIRIEARVGDTDGLVECLLRLVEDGGSAQWIPMTLADGTTSLGCWETVLAPRPAGTSLEWRVRVSDGTLVAETNDEATVIAGSDSPVVLNEILADPPPDLAGDANGDGVRGTADDEFVELVNRSSEIVDLSGWALWDGTAVRHEFPLGSVLGPGEFFVVFGGGVPTGVPSATDVASSGGLSLNNSGDSVSLVGSDGVSRDVHAYGAEANADQSLIRVPDGTGDWTRPGDVGFGWAFTAGLPNEGASALSQASWSKIKALYRR
jgi:hypothetical protein